MAVVTIQYEGVETTISATLFEVVADTVAAKIVGMENWLADENPKTPVNNRLASEKLVRRLKKAYEKLSIIVEEMEDEE